jgi:hypothetical protein
MLLTLSDLQIYTDSFEIGGWDKWCAAFLKADNYWVWVQHRGA